MNTAGRHLSQRKILSVLNKLDGGYMDPQQSEEQLFDILQALFNEDLAENTKLLLLMQVQEQIDYLVHDTDRAEQAVGPLINVYKYLNQHSFIKSQVLSTIGLICVYFDLKNEKSACFQDYVTLLLDVVLKNTSGALLLSTCCSCLQLLEDYYQGFLLDYLDNLMIIADMGRSFACSNFMHLIGSIISHVQTSNQICKISVDEGKESNTSNEDNGTLDMLKYQLFVMKQAPTLSSTCLLQVFPKILLNGDIKKFPKSVVMSLFTYCCQSSDILLIYLAHVLQIKFSLYLQINDDSKFMLLLMKLLLLQDFKQLPQKQNHLIKYLITDTIKHLPTASLKLEAFIISIPTLQPNIYENSDSKLQKVNGVYNIAIECQQTVPENIQFSIMKCLFHDFYNLSNQIEVMKIFQAFFVVFKHGSDSLKDAIVQLLQRQSIHSMTTTGFIVNFCRLIKPLGERLALQLLKHVSIAVLAYELNDIESWLSYFHILNQLSQEKDVCPLILVNKLESWCNEGTFNELTYGEGNVLLSVLSNVLIYHQKVDYSYQVASILWTLSKNSMDYNMSEQALFYYCIIGNVSPKNYKQMFTGIHYTMKHQLHAQQNKNKIQQREIIPIMNDSLTTIKQKKNNFLLFTKIVHNKTVLNELHIHQREDILEEYYKFLHSEECNRDVILKYSLSCDKNIEDIPNELFAINLSFDCSSTTLEQIKDVNCPYIAKDLYDEEYQEFLLKIRPKRSVPTEIQVSATYFDDSNQCCMLQLDKMKIHFEHLFNPLPKLNDEDYGDELFNRIWDHITNTQKSNATPDNESGISVKNLGSTIRWDDIVEKFKSFIVHESIDSLNVGIYLPPKHHLLMKIKMQNKMVIVTIATDNYTIINMVDDYLNGMKE